MQVKSRVGFDDPAPGYCGLRPYAVLSVRRRHVAVDRERLSQIQKASISVCAERANIVSSMPPLSSLGELEVVVMLAAVRLGSEGTGAVIRDEIERRSGRHVARGSVYVTLDRLEEKGLLTSRLEAGTPERGGHPRRLFRATAYGLKSLRASLSVFARMQEGLESVLGET